MDRKTYLTFMKQSNKEEDDAALFMLTSGKRNFKLTGNKIQGFDEFHTIPIDEAKIEELIEFLSNLIK